MNAPITRVLMQRVVVISEYTAENPPGLFIPVTAEGEIVGSGYSGSEYGLPYDYYVAVEMDDYGIVDLPLEIMQPIGDARL